MEGRIVSIVRFAEICDNCGKRSEEYSRWRVCRLCGNDTCEDCDLVSQRDDETCRTLCKDCLAVMG